MKTTNPVRPFFSRSLNDYVVDALCECGHLHSEHGSHIVKIGLHMVRTGFHDGSCCHGRCQCQQFTWVRWVGVEEAADRLEQKCSAA